MKGLLKLQSFNNKAKTNNIKHLFKYLTPYKALLCAVLIALLITSSSFLLLSKAVGDVIDHGLMQQNVEMLNSSLLYFILLIIALAIATAARFCFVTLLGELVVRDIRRDVYSQILRLSSNFYEENKSGEILARLTNDTTLLQTIIGSSISVAARNSVMLIGSFTMLVIANFKLTIIMFGVLPVVIVPIIFFSRKMRNFAKLAQEKVADLSAISEETIGYIKTIQAYHCEEKERNIFGTKLAETLSASTTRIKTKALLIFIVITLIFGGIAFVLWIGGNDVISGKLTGGELSSFIILSIICASTMAALTEVLSDFQKAIGASERLIEFLLIEPAIKEKDRITHSIADQQKLSITFSNVTFHYPSKPNQPIFQHLSFHVPSNKTIAIVGESGVGKTTIFQLLLRFYDIQSGNIQLNGIDISNISLKDLRSSFAYVSQEPIIFSRSVLENISYGTERASMDDIIKAAQDAAALEFIEQLPNKFETFLGEKGVRISGGQRQRIAIARAILKNPKILLLDEATSALDTLNEQLVQAAIEKLMQNRTTIIIAHRLSTIKNADIIFVMKDGKIIESGDHNTLLEKQGEYASLLNQTFLKNH